VATEVYNWEVSQNMTDIYVWLAFDAVSLLVVETQCAIKNPTLHFTLPMMEVAFSYDFGNVTNS
jgi:hypothetical protein